MFPYYLFNVSRICSDIHSIFPDIGNLHYFISFSLFCISLATSSSILLIFLRKQLLVLLIFLNCLSVFHFIDFYCAFYCSLSVRSFSQVEKFSFCLEYLEFLLFYYEKVFSSIQSLSRVRLFATPWTAAHRASLFITNSRGFTQTHLH